MDYFIPQRGDVAEMEIQKEGIIVNKCVEG
jgi:hypothetical protein